MTGKCSRTVKSGCTAFCGALSSLLYIVLTPLSTQLNIVHTGFYPSRNLHPKDAGCTVVWPGMLGSQPLRLSALPYLAPVHHSVYRFSYRFKPRKGGDCRKIFKRNLVFCQILFWMLPAQLCRSELLKNNSVTALAFRIGFSE